MMFTHLQELPVSHVTEHKLLGPMCAGLGLCGVSCLMSSDVSHREDFGFC